MRSLHVASVAIAALALAACTGPTPETDVSPSQVGTIDSISVGQSDTQAPSLTYDLELDFLEPDVSLLWDGEGDELVSGQPLLLDVYGESLDTGDVVINTFDGSPEAYLLTPESVGQELYDVLIDAHVGARVLAVEPSEIIDNTAGIEVGDGARDDEGQAESAPPVALVIDVRSEHAVGEEQEQPATMPVVSAGESGEPRVVIPEDPEPVADLQVATLVRGAGPQILPDSRVLINYTMFYYTDGELEDSSTGEVETWSAGDVFDSTWPLERAPYMLDMASGSAVTGLTQGLIDQTEGSRVEMLVPGSVGYPLRGTMVMVVDVLDVWNAED